MFRLISLLVVIAVLAILWLVVADSTTGAGCATRNGTTTTLPPELTRGLGAGATGVLKNC